MTSPFRPPLEKLNLKILPREINEFPSDDITEYYIPVRFLFLVIGPPTESVDYHEVGRSIATIMSNQVITISDCFLYLVNCHGLLSWVTS